MCGRYSLGVRMNYVRRRMQEQGMQVSDAPDDDSVRETFNFAPGYNGAVYCADSYIGAPAEQDNAADPPSQEEKDKTEKEATYKLQAMKWGLVPSWTKRQPDYGSLMRTINCRDDSLVEDRGMWTSMKRTKRCVVVCQGFYEWLKKGPGGKEKVPHFVRRKDGDLMYFAGLWDCVSYEGSNEKLYTYTIITTSSNSYLKFLHDRMPAILDPNSEKMKTWMDPTRKTWSKDLQAVLKPYQGELECYPVPKEVGKVGNNSAEFIIPIKKNKSNIANFFANAKKKAEPEAETEKQAQPKKVETNAPEPGVKREHPTEHESSQKKTKIESTTPSPKKTRSPDLAAKKQSPPSGRKTRSATHNGQKPVKEEKKATDGSKRITSFFGK